MMRIRWTTWRRDVLVGVLASALTASLLVPLGWAAVRDQREQAAAAHRTAEAAQQLAEQKAAEAEEQRAYTQRKLIEDAADFAGVVGIAGKGEAEVMHVTTAAVSPEVPRGAHLLIDKKAPAYAAGDIVIYRAGGNNYLGRVVSVDKESGRLTLGRNGEDNRHVAAGDVVGRGVLNTR
jgi:hypothetical protein